MDVIGAQVDGRRKNQAQDVLSQIATLESEGKGEDEEVEVRIGEKKPGIIDNRVLLKGTIKELKANAEKKLTRRITKLRREYSSNARV